MILRTLIAFTIGVLLQVQGGPGYVFAQTGNMTRQEMLRGSVTPEREWWDVLHYHLKVEFFPETRRLKGSNAITFKSLKAGDKMQIDLQPPLAITKVTHGDSQLEFEREGNVYWVTFEKDIPKGVEDKVEVFYEGVPVASKNPRSYEDYMASLTSRYRKAARQIEKEVAGAGCTVEELPDAGRHAAELHELYMQTHRNARLRLVTLPEGFIPTLAARLGDEMRCTVVRRGEELLGFVTTVRDGETAVGYYIGFDRGANAELPVYFRLLQSVVDDAIRLGCRRLSLGRTALEPKARLGARPAPMRVWIRHRIPALNVVVRALLHTVPHDEAPERSPFK